MKKSEESKTDYSNAFEFTDSADKTDYSNNVVFDIQGDESSPFIPSDKIALNGYFKERDMGRSQSVLSLTEEDTHTQAPRKRPPATMTSSREDSHSKEKAHSTEESTFADIRRALDELEIQPSKGDDSLDDIFRHIRADGNGTVSEELDKLWQAFEDAEISDEVEELSRKYHSPSVPTNSDDEQSPVASFSDEETIPVRVKPEHKSKSASALQEDEHKKRREIKPKAQSDFITSGNDADVDSDDLRKVKSDSKHNNPISNFFGHITPHLGRKKTNDTTISSSPPKTESIGSRPTSPIAIRKSSKPEGMEGSSPKYSKRKTSRPEEMEGSSPQGMKRSDSKPKSLERELTKEKRSRDSRPDSPEMSSSPPQHGSRPSSPTQQRKGSKPKSLERDTKKEVRRKESDPQQMEAAPKRPSRPELVRKMSKIFVGDSISSDTPDEKEVHTEDLRQLARKVSSYQLTHNPLGHHISDGDIEEVLKFRLAHEPEHETTTLIYKAISDEARMEDVMVRRLLHCYSNQFSQAQVHEMVGNTNAEKECGKVYELLQHGAFWMEINLGENTIKYGEKRPLHHRVRHKIHKDDLENDKHTTAAQYIAAFNLMNKSSVSQIALRIQNRDFKPEGVKYDVVEGEINQNAVIAVMKRQFTEVNGVLYLVANHIASIKGKNTWDIMSGLCSANLDGIIQATSFERYYRDEFTKALGSFTRSRIGYDAMNKMFDNIDRARNEVAIT